MSLYTIESSGGKMSARPSGSGLVNIIGKYSTVKSIDIPEIRLKESEILQSSIVTQAKYSTAVASGSFNKILELCPAGVKGKLKDIMSAADIPDSDDPFDGLYDSEPTGFIYTLPYYNEGPVFTKSADFAETYKGDGLMDAASDLYNAFKKISIGTNQLVKTLTEPGVFLLKPRFYDPGSSTQSVSFSFPLLNTLNEEDIQSNYDLVWLLLFQNCVKRLDRSAFVPPCIYEVTVPGYTYMKFGYVESISVDFLGTRRTMDIGGVNTIIPEAYNISITLRQLTTDVAEFFDKV